MLAFRHGGGAFLVPYFLALVFIGVPIFVLELALGQVSQSGDIISFGSLHKRFRGIGLSSVLGAFFVVTYYSCIIAWCLVYAAHCFSSTLPWAPVNEETSLKAAAGEFFVKVTGAKGLDAANGSINWESIVALAVVWITMVVCIIGGVKSVGRAIYVTGLVPLVTLCVLVARGATLSGASEGITQFIGRFELEELQKGSAWSDACGQIFFSLGVTFGIMTCYSSYNRRRQNLVVDACAVAFLDSIFVSLLAGFAVFSTLGFLAQETDTAIENLPVGGLSLAFMTYPVALAKLPAPQFFCLLFFLTLFLLGVDSAFSMVEAVCTAIQDSTTFKRVPRRRVVLAVSALGFAISLIFITDFGLYLLDCTDAFINTPGMIFIGFLETLAVNLYHVREWRALVGDLVVCLSLGSWTFGCALGAVIAFTVGGDWGIALGASVGAVSMLSGQWASMYMVRRDTRPHCDWRRAFHLA
ncbi:MAG: hypothetical protein MHM6MM_005512, partial [Cercozoa sp. M6MM]